jgi:uncharacterized protein GlcG (DUF336 family)
LSAAVFNAALLSVPLPSAPLRRLWTFLVLLAVLAAPASALSPAINPPAYTAADLDRIQQQAADRAMERFPRAVIAIVDRDGRELVLRRANGAGSITANERAIAVAKAGTAVFLSSNEHAFTPRTASFIIQQNFPPGVRNRPPGPLVGVGLSNLAYSDINYFRTVAGARIPLTRLRASPGGVPLYKNGRLFAGVGVHADGTEAEFTDEDGYAQTLGPDEDEAIALSGQLGYAPDKRLHGTGVLIDGLRIPYVKTPARRARVAGAAPVIPAAPPPAPVVWPLETLGGVTGQVRAAIVADPVPGLIDGQARLSEPEVRAILAAAAARARQTRAGIRLPAGRPAQVFISVVNNPAAPGVAPSVLGTFRTPDATLFSWDVSVQKARTCVYYSTPERALSARAVGFLSQSNYPPGIHGRPPGPLDGEQFDVSLPLLVSAASPLNGDPALPNGITIFAGGFPLYRNGVIVGAIGVSGDGIDQDDIIAASGAALFPAAAGVRSDAHFEGGVRLPYAKFPRDSQLRREVRPLVTGP